VIRKLIAIAGVAVLGALLAPTSANAAQVNAGVIVFTGDAQVSPGLCLPGVANPNCALGGVSELQPGNSTWNFDVPGSPIVTPVATLPSTCNALGIFDGVTAVPSGDPGNCEINADGIVTPNLRGALVGPSCGLSGGITTDDPAQTGNEDTFSIGTVSGTISTEWLSSAGGTLPIHGHLSVPDSDGSPENVFYVGVVQARPIPQGAGEIPCVNAPATTFTVVGVVAGAGLDDV